MQIVIDIPEEDYIRLRDEGMFGNVTTFKRAVREGIPLEQEPCEDIISRQAVLDMVEREQFKGDAISEIEKLPPVTPQYTDTEIQKMQDLEFAEIQKAYEIGKTEGSEVLDKIRAEIIDTLYVDSLIFGELIDFRNGKISADDVIEEFNRVTRLEVLQIIDKYKASPTGAERSEKE